MKILYRDYHELPIGKCMAINATGSIDDDTERTLAILRIMTGATDDELLSLPVVEFSRLTASCAWLTEQPKPHKVGRRYVLDGTRYRLTTDTMQMTAAQFIDYQHVGGTDDIIGTLAVALVPDGHTYGNGYDIEEVKEAIRNTMPTDDAVFLLPFFVASLLKSSQRTLQSSVRMAARLKMKKVTDGAGCRR